MPAAPSGGTVGVRWSDPDVTGSLSIKVVGAGSASTTFKKVSDDSSVVFPLTVDEAGALIYTAVNAEYEVSFIVNGEEIAASPSDGVVTTNLLGGNAFIFAPSAKRRPITFPKVAFVPNATTPTAAEVNALRDAMVNAGLMDAS